MTKKFISHFIVCMLLLTAISSNAISQNINAIREITAFLNIKPEKDILLNTHIVAANPEYVKHLYGLLFIKPMDYQKCVIKSEYGKVKLYNNKIVEILIHTDTLNRIERIAYIVKIESSAIVDSLSKSLGPIQLFASFNKKFLSNNEMVEQIYYWEYDRNTELLLSFFDKRQCAEIFPLEDSDLAVIMVYRKIVTPKN